MYFLVPRTHPLTATRKFCDDDDDQPDHAQKIQTQQNFVLREQERGNTKASRKAAKAAAEPKTPSPRAQTRRRSGHGQIHSPPPPPPNRHRRRRRRGRPLLLSPWPFSLQQMSFKGLARICGGEQPPIPAAKMTFVLVLGRNGKTSSLLSSRPTCCVPSPSVEESMSYSTTRKNGRSAATSQGAL